MSVIVLGISGFLIVLGVTGLAFGFHAVSRKPAAAKATIALSLVALVLGVAIAFAYWLFRKLTD